MAKTRERETTIVFEAMGEYRVVIVVSPDLKQSLTRRDFKVPDDLDSCKAITVNLKDVTESVIFLRHRSSVAAIVHECWHVIYRMFDYFGASLEDEIVAYHLDYLTQKAFNFVHRKS